MFYLPQCSVSWLEIKVPWLHCGHKQRQISYWFGIIQNGRSHKNVNYSYWMFVIKAKDRCVTICRQWVKGRSFLSNIDLILVFANLISVELFFLLVRCQHVMETRIYHSSDYNCRPSWTLAHNFEHPFLWILALALVLQSLLHRIPLFPYCFHANLES